MDNSKDAEKSFKQMQVVTFGDLRNDAAGTSGLEN